MGESRIEIDRDECILCASCWEACPEVLEESPEDGLTQVVEQYRTEGDPGKGKVSEELEGCVQEAADDCPVEIIHVEAV